MNKYFHVIYNVVFFFLNSHDKEYFDVDQNFPQMSYIYYFINNNIY